MNNTFPFEVGSVILTKTKTAVVLNVLEIRTLMLCSLGAQTILTIFCNRRKYRLNFFIRFLVWLSYLIAGPIGTLVMGKFSEMSDAAYDVKENEIVENYFYGLYGAVISWWAPLLLVHICSPNVVIYSVEENKMKLRQVVGLTTLGVISIWIFYKSWVRSKYQGMDMIPLYVVGIIKFGERLRGLRLINKSENVVKTTFANNDLIAREIIEESRSCSELIVSRTFSDGALLMKAYQRLDRLKPYLENWLGHPSSMYLPSMSIDNYLPKDVFRIIEFELSFMYDVLYTKMPISYCKRSFLGHIIFLVLCLLISLLPIYFWVDYHTQSLPVTMLADNIISFVLVVGAILLEIYEIKELLYSDWAIVHMMEQNKSAFMRRLLRIVASKTPRKKHRWSHCINQLNLISYCLYEDPTKLGGLIRRISKIKGYYKEYKKYSVKKDIQVPEELKKLILQQMEEVKAQRGWQPFSKCGEWALERCNCLQDLKWSIHGDFGTQAKKQTNFGKTIITWHIATTVCYHLEDSQSQGTITHSQYGMSKVLSDYMMCLLTMHPDMLSIVVGDILFCGVCSQVGEFLRTKQSNDEATLCRILVDELVDEDHFQGIPKKNMLTSEWNVLFQVKKLVGILREREDRWRIISSVWVEMLCYGASNCPWTLHAEQLRRGGELLTHVWLLLEHEKDKLDVLSPELESVV